MSWNPNGYFLMAGGDDRHHQLIADEEALHGIHDDTLVFEVMLGFFKLELIE